MPIVKLLRTVLGLDDSDSEESTDVTVEHDPDTDDAAAAGTDATASTGSMTEEPPEDEESAAEPAEAGTDVSDHSGTDTPAAESAEAAGPVPDEAEGGSEPVENVSGIGPAYAKRLDEAGIETVQDLLDADAEELAAETDLSEKRIGRWQDRATET
ncbi:helix-hairpin-helix domain-containing protein [Natronomonas amylolytica]|uniref:helix-hairpin-helix domain-containing protein n=1 Tax=Natronomonas amylolytica TaxID=3108498 RepID=UPI003009E04A